MAIDLNEEKEYLEKLKAELKREADGLLSKMEYHSDKYREFARYLWEYRSELDGGETLFNRILLNGIVDVGEQTREQFRRIMKMLYSPYFSRIDFLMPEDLEPMKIYIGKFPFWNSVSDCQVFDWRAPISSMYYEFEDGPAYYDAPGGQISGEITCKRQYRIVRGELEYAIESSLNIDDEILMQELARSSDHRMKDIVSTIQREQNRLIRNESADVLIIQGAAGSGKTSIALHRVAYFLYRYRNEISADNFLIISPNGIFVDYISEVLPELGEESIRSLGMESLASMILPKELRWEPLSGQPERFLQTGDEDWKERSRFKSSLEFLYMLKEYLDFCDEHLFQTADYCFEGGMVEAEFIGKLYERRKNIPVKQRIREAASAIKEEIRAQNRPKAKGAHINEIQDWMETRLEYRDAMEVYRGFYRHIGHPELFMYKEEGILESADIFPFLYVKLYMDGRDLDENVKYLLVDEMQDYTPVQYAVLNKLYPCHKTLLGDFAQNVAPFAGNSLEFLRQQYPQAQIIEIDKSYRSTYEIMNFAKQVGNIEKLEPMQRHGAEPEIIACESRKEVRRAALHAVKDHLMQGKGKMGLICKSFSQAESLCQHLKSKLAQEHLSTMEENVHLLTPKSEEFYDGVMVMSVAMSKGLEFDEVIIIDADDKNYHTEYERGLLYVACTRAMHRLAIVYSGAPSRFLPA